MKIEKISETQIKFILTKDDLVERDIKITELAYGSTKTQELFREMLEQALLECNFEADNVPLMIEAIPITSESIVIIVTKVTDHTQIEEKFSLLPRSKDTMRKKYRSKGAVEPPKESKEPAKDSGVVTVFSFESLEDASRASARVYMSFDGTSILYKNDSRYFLFISKDDSGSMEHIDSVLSEYGEKHYSTVITRYFLAEHGEVLIGADALRILATI